LRINIQIERLVFDGVELPGGMRPRMQEAFESELAHLLVQNGLSQELLSGVALTSLNGQAIEIARGARPQVLGQQIAQAVYKGIGQ
jgi:hypothetical protein